METTTKETTSANLPRRHPLKTRHLTVNTPPTDVTLVKKHGTSIDDLKNKVVNAINAESAKEHGSLTDMALAFLMWAITTTIAVIIVLIKKWLSERCATHEQPMARESPDVQQQQHPNPVYSPGQLSIVPLMVMHSPPSSNSALSSITSTPEMEEIEEEEEEEPVGHRTRRSCVKKLNWSKTSAV
ncbi:uncharacterized protein LOC128172739 [Crassostrea angulata]|uniref:uncharacterized protein LOC128172739 n=1 Tax=Magallana angulata TaxID=2784310 RepID=UPI0022B10EBA|nr:uncharacterized protein LOC128172739 [Crassostrea angulata]